MIFILLYTIFLNLNILKSILKKKKNDYWSKHVFVSTNNEHRNIIKHLKNNNIKN